MIECRHLLDDGDIEEKESFLGQIKRIETWYSDDEKRTKYQYEDCIKTVEKILTEIRVFIIITISK